MAPSVCMALYQEHDIGDICHENNGGEGTGEMGQGNRCSKTQETS